MKSDRRKESRRALRLPVFVKGHDAGGTAWDEVAHSLEVASGGASFVLHHPVVAGQVTINIRLVRSDPGTGVREEFTVTENIGLGGARVPTSLPIVKGETVTLVEVKRAFRVRAQVLNVSVGRDNVPRLNLKFVDPEAASTMKHVLQQLRHPRRGRLSGHAKMSLEAKTPSLPSRCLLRRRAQRGRRQ